MLKSAILGLALLCVSLPAVAKNHKDGLIPILSGYFCSPEISETIVAEDTVTGVINTIDIVPGFLSYETRIPAKIGITFGIKTLDPIPVAEPITVVTTHPSMGAALITHESFLATNRPDQPYYAGYAFEKAFELVTGVWTFTGIAPNGRIIFTETFNVVKPSTLLTAAPPCNTSPMTSKY